MCTPAREADQYPDLVDQMKPGRVLPSLRQMMQGGYPQECPQGPGRSGRVLQFVSHQVVHEVLAGESGSYCEQLEGQCSGREEGHLQRRHCLRGHNHQYQGKAGAHPYNGPGHTLLVGVAHAQQGKPGHLGDCAQRHP